MKGFLIGLGAVAAIMLMLYPKIKGLQQDRHVRQDTVQDDARRFERQARVAQDVTATEEDEREDRRNVRRDMTDEEISSRKNLQPPEHWRWKYEADAPENIDCEDVPFPPWYVCHTRFERPLGYYQPPPMPPRSRQQPRFVRYGPPVHVRVPCRGGCPYPGG